MTGVRPALFGQLLVPFGPASERSDLTHPLDAVDHVGVNVPHSAANLGAQAFYARVGEERADRHGNEERRQRRGRLARRRWSKRIAARRV